MTPEELAEKVVKFCAANMGRESALLTPVPAIIMTDPYGLFDMLRDELKLTPEKIDGWLCEVQGIKP